MNTAIRMIEYKIKSMNNIRPHFSPVMFQVSLSLCTYSIRKQVFLGNIFYQGIFYAYSKTQFQENPLLHTH